MSAAPKSRRGGGTELSAVNIALRDATDELERDLLNLMSKVGLTRQLVEDHGRHWSWLAQAVDTNERLDLVLRQHLDGHPTGAEGVMLEAVEHAAVLHRATHPYWPVRAVTHLVNSYLLVHQSRGSAMDQALTELLHAGRIAGAAAAEIDSVFPRLWTSAAAQFSQAHEFEGAQQKAEQGRAGAEAKHALARALKTWALKERAKMHGGDADIAKELASRVPQHLRDAVKNPQRVIYEALNKRSRETRGKLGRG